MLVWFPSAYLKRGLMRKWPDWSGVSCHSLSFKPFSIPTKGQVRKGESEEWMRCGMGRGSPPPKRNPLVMDYLCPTKIHMHGFLVALLSSSGSHRDKNPTNSLCVHQFVQWLIWRFSGKFQTDKDVDISVNLK